MVSSTGNSVPSRRIPVSSRRRSRILGRCPSRARARPCRCAGAGTAGRSPRPSRGRWPRSGGSRRSPRSVVPADHPSRVIHRDDGVERRFQHRPESRLVRPTSSSAWRRATNWPPGSRTSMVASTSGPVATLMREKFDHSDAAAGLRSGKPERGMEPCPRATSARGKFPSWGASMTQAASPDSTTRPGSPSPGQMQPLARMPRIHGRSFALVQVLTQWSAPLRGSPPRRPRAPSQAPPDRLERRLVYLDRLLGFGEDPGDRMLHSLEVSDRRLSVLAFKLLMTVATLHLRRTDGGATRRRCGRQRAAERGNRFAARGLGPCRRRPFRRREDLMLKVRSYSPDVAIVDVRMPPGTVDEGLPPPRDPQLPPRRGVLVLSQHLEPRTCSSSLAKTPRESGTCSRTGSTTSPSSWTRSSASPGQARRSTRRS